MMFDIYSPLLPKRASYDSGEEAIRRSPHALDYASDDLKNDEALVRLAISSSPSALSGAADRFLGFYLSGLCVYCLWSSP